MSASWPMRRPWVALVLWLVALVGVQAVAAVAGSAFHDDHTLPGTESQTVADTLASAEDQQSRDSVSIVVRAEDGDVAARPEVKKLLTRAEGLPGVESVQPPSQEAHSLSEDGTIGYATVRLGTTPLETDDADVVRIIDTAEAAAGPDLEVAVGGDAAREASAPEGGSEMVGMAAALIILLVLFGSFLAAAMPILSAVFAVGTAVGLAGLVSHLVDVPSYATPMMMLVGLGVGIDYALLIFSRYRDELLEGRDRESAARVAQRTAGRSVLFAGAIVVLALLGLVVLGLGSLRGLAVAVAVTVLLTLLASMSLLPALLALFGRRIERSVRRRAARRRPGRIWERISDRVRDHSWLSLALGLGVIVVLTLPLFGMRLGFADAGTDPEDSSPRQAYEMMADGFGPGANGPLVVVADSTTAQADAAGDAIRATPGVADVTGPLPLEGTDESLLLVFPTTGPSDEQTADLVHRLRDGAIADLESAGGEFLVGGGTAAIVDYGDAIADRLPWFVLAVVGISTLLLAAVFRSVLIPLKAAVLNLLSIGAALGVMTWVFGDGHLGAQAGPIEAFLPVIIFAVVFGLSMDYEVFLVSRMHEEWRRTADAGQAVRRGLATTGGVITAAAAIMVVVFGAFVLSPGRMLAQMGLGLATAVFIDAVVIRCLLVPAFMHLTGRAAWWLPPWLDRRLPEIRLEGGETTARPVIPSSETSAARQVHDLTGHGPAPRSTPSWNHD